MASQAKARRLGIPVIFLALVALVASMSSASAQDFITGTSSASYPEDPGFEGYWKYCIEVSWDLTSCGSALSHISLDTMLGECECVCDPGYFAFADTIGTGIGVDSCTVYYHGEFLCTGDPTIPGLDGPGLKFEYIEGGCEPDLVGTASICFYSVAAPTDAQTYANVLAAKAGTCDAVWGDLAGVLPTCDCGGVPVEPSPWGSVKALFGR